MGFLTSGAIPDNIAKLISPADRKKVGKGAMTLDDAVAKAEKKEEQLLQDQVRAILEAHRGIVVIYSRMDRKTTTPLGTPDFIFAIGKMKATRDGCMTFESIFACAWEIKTPSGEQSEEQIKMQERMETPPNAWRYRIIRSVEEARRELSEMGVS